ncbi:crossover junction endonuclease EME1 isoform 2-T3 [Odontesthes bonariensis]
MGSYSDCTSDLDEELPVFDFLQPCRHLSQASQTTTQKPDLVNLEDSDAEHAVISSLKKGNAGTHTGTADAMMISSDSDDDSPYVPLAQRLKHRHENVISASSIDPNGRDAEQCLPSQLASSEPSSQKGFSESEHPHSLHQFRTVSPKELEDFPKLPLKPLSTTESSDTSPAKGKPTKRMAEEIQASKEEALRRRQARRRQQQDREALRQEQERQKAEKKALAEATKALRPEECIKHMVVSVDPALLQLEGGGTLLASVQALGCSCCIEKQLIPRSVSWIRRAPCAQLHEGECVPEAHIVMQMTEEDFITLIHNYIQAVVHLQLYTGVSVHFLSTWKEFSDHITMTTKAVAEAPFKQEKEKTGFTFYLESEWAGGQRVDKAGKGLLQVWKRQIQQFNRVSPDMAAAILAAYPSPQLLKKAYSQCRSDGAKVSLLSDLLIRRGEGVTSTTRRVGPEFSKRLHLMMHSCDPELTLDSSL